MSDLPETIKALNPPANKGKQMADAGQWDVTVVRSYTNSGKPDELAKFKSVTGVTVSEGALVLDSGSEVAAVFAAGQWVTFYRDVHLTEFAELTF